MRLYLGLLRVSIGCVWFCSVAQACIVTPEQVQSHLNEVRLPATLKDSSGEYIPPEVVILDQDGNPKGAHFLHDVFTADYAYDYHWMRGFV